MTKSDGTEIYYEYDDSDSEASNMKAPSRPIKMGKEQSLWKAIQNFDDDPATDKDCDLKALTKTEVTVSKLFGLGNQYKPAGVSLNDKYPGEGIDLDKKFDADSPYHVETDHMLPLIPPFSDLKLRYSTDFSSGEVCVYRYKGESYCNQIFKENGKITAHSLNPKYKPVVLDPEEYHFIAVIDSVHYFLKGRSIG